MSISFLYRYLLFFFFLHSLFSSPVSSQFLTYSPSSYSATYTTSDGFVRLTPLRFSSNVGGGLTFMQSISVWPSSSVIQSFFSFTANFPIPTVLNSDAITFGSDRYLNITVNATAAPLGVYRFYLNLTYVEQSRTLQSALPMAITIEPKIGLTPAIAPYTLSESQSIVQSIVLKSRPASPVQLGIIPNVLSAEIPGVSSGGLQYSGGGPLLTVSATSLTFTPSDWYLPQTLTITAIPTPVAWGSRWSCVNFSVLTSDPDYSPIVLPLLNITIIELRSPGVVFNVTSFTLLKTSGPRGVSVVLSSQPASDVSFRLPSDGHTKFSVENFLFTPSSWNVPIEFQLSLIPNNVMEGTRRFQYRAAISSLDRTYGNSFTQTITIDMTDTNLLAAVLQPNSGPSSGGTVVTVSVAPRFSFNVAGLGDTSMPDIRCQFGDDGIIPAQIIPATIVTPYTVTCTVPACYYIADDVINGCFNPYPFYLIVNGQRSDSSLSSFYYLFTPEQKKIIAIGTVTPSEVDVRRDTVVTLTGTNFLANFPSPSDNPFLKCSVGSRSGLTASYRVNPTTNAYEILCNVPARLDLSGSANNIPQTVLISLNGVNYVSSSSGRILNYADYTYKKDQTVTAVFFVVIAMSFLLLSFIFTSCYCCAGICRKQENTVEEKKVRELSGPEKLIELLEPRVAEKSAIVKEIERIEAEEKETQLKIAEERKRRAKLLRDQQMERLRAEKEERRKKKLAIIEAKKEKTRDREEETNRLTVAGVDIPAETDSGTGSATGSENTSAVQSLEKEERKKINDRLKEELQLLQPAQESQENEKKKKKKDKKERRRSLSRGGSGSSSSDGESDSGSEADQAPRQLRPNAAIDTIAEGEGEEKKKKKKKDKDKNKKEKRRSSRSGSRQRTAPAFLTPLNLDSARPMMQQQPSLSASRSVNDGDVSADTGGESSDGMDSPRGAAMPVSLHLNTFGIPEEKNDKKKHKKKSAKKDKEKEKDRDKDKEKHKDSKKKKKKKESKK